MKSLNLAIAIIAFAFLSSFTNSVNKNFENTEPVSNSSEVKFRIQLGSYYNEAPEADLKIMEEIGGITPMKSKGKTVYVTKEFDSEHEASIELPVMRSKGFKNAMKIVIIEDYIMGARTYHLFYDKRKTTAAEKNKLFTPEIRVIRD
jgi:uncharacterized GH25 family protein